MTEIEVVVDPKRQQNGDTGRNPNRSPGAPIADPIVNVCSASAYGDLEKLRGFVERDGQSVSIPDGHGYYALQWAALNNFPDVAQYLIEVGDSAAKLWFLTVLGWLGLKILLWPLLFPKHGGDVNGADHRRQTALHWAAVHGSIPVADVLSVRGPPATGRFRQKLAVGGRLSEKSTVGGRLSEKLTVGGRLRKKKGRRRGKKEEGNKEYLNSAVVARGLAATAAAFSPARGDGASPRARR
ncbi:hypothetical protein BHE74_00036167, partial [Ensete ventricosum]